MASGADLIRNVKQQIQEIDPKDVHEVVAAGQAPRGAGGGSPQMSSNGNNAVIVDVREQHEFEESHLPGAVHVPRGHLESRVEGLVPDRSGRVILYCASGNRSATRTSPPCGAASRSGRTAATTSRFPAR
jgi:hypothetical protein